MSAEDAMLQEVAYLTLLSIEGRINEAQFDRLESLLQKELSARKLYYQLINNDAFLYDFDVLLRSEDPQKLEFKDLLALGEYEMQAPVIEISKDKKEPSRELISKVVYKRTPHRLRKTNVFSLLISAAAILFVVLFVKVVPQTVEVATVVDQMNTRWAPDTSPIKTGSSLYNSGGSRQLLQGCLKLHFLNGAEVVIEGPAEFAMKSGNSMYLDYGRLYATVSERAKGFTVNTQHCNIVDLGTEFGVKAGYDGTSEVHMIRGKAVVSSDLNDGTPEPVEVSKGQALRASPSLGQMVAIELEQRLFARDVSSQAGLIWRGEPIDLANLASGGDGVSSPGTPATINPVTGRQSAQIKKDRPASNNYVVVDWNPYVDGVFVPNGQTTQTVTSAGHTFADCPQTNGICFTNIVVYQEPYQRIVAMDLDGVDYGYSDRPGIFIHPNIGMTYDLDRIRELGLKGELVFRSKIGISESAPRNTANADFWVLVDGAVRYEKRNVKQRGCCVDSIEVRLDPNDRFLTLMTTDGGGEEWVMEKNGKPWKLVRSTDSDWCVFAEPFISVD